MVKKITISLDDWVLKDMIGEVENKSARIKELVIKGYMKELESKTKTPLGTLFNLARKQTSREIPM